MPNETKRTPIDASPTKEFFISMLVRDIDLLDAVADLVDNCVDGARRLKGGDSFEGLFVHITLSKTEFRIVDNCGGIAVDLARDYAFRFGRPEDFPKTRHSIGQFGIGMKRALFKMGKTFRVESSTRRSHFVVQENVDKWKAEIPTEEGHEEGDAESNGADQQPYGWRFHFNELTEKSPKPLTPGTTITVTDLYEGVASQFDLENFRNELQKKLATIHLYSISKGLEVKVSGIRLPAEQINLLTSKAIKPVFRTEELAKGLRVKLYAGVAISDPEKAGWYVFCNGRMILVADQSERTGWGEGHGRKIPRFHNQFAMFRGYVFFDADSAEALPWNTTKTDVDYDSASYQTIRSIMVVVMRPIIDFLNELDQERTATKTGKPGTLQMSVDTAKPKDVTSIKRHLVFTSPALKKIVRPKSTQRISYERLAAEVKRVKAALGARTVRGVGEGTFDYYYRVVCKGK